MSGAFLRCLNDALEWRGFPRMFKADMSDREFMNAIGVLVLVGGGHSNETYKDFDDIKRELGLPRGSGAAITGVIGWRQVQTQLASIAIYDGDKTEWPTDQFPKMTWSDAYDRLLKGAVIGRRDGSNIRSVVLEGRNSIEDGFGATIVLGPRDFEATDWFMLHDGSK